MINSDTCYFFIELLITFIQLKWVQLTFGGLQSIGQLNGD